MVKRIFSLTFVFVLLVLAVFRAQAQVVHDVAVIDVTLYSMFYGHVDRAYPTWAVPLFINVTVSNRGNFTETFNVTLHYNLTATDWVFIGNLTFTDLTADAQAWSTFDWIIKGVRPSVVNHTYTTYAIRAEAVLAGDANPADNTLSDSLWMKYPGDANGNGFVDIGDLGYLGFYWFQRWTRLPELIPEPIPIPPGSLLDADFDGSGLVDIGDFGILGAYWFKGICNLPPPSPPL